MLQNQTAAIGQSRGPSTDMRTPSQTIKPAVRAEGTRDRQGMKDGDYDRHAVKAWRQLKRKSKRGDMGKENHFWFTPAPTSPSETRTSP